MNIPTILMGVPVWNRIQDPTEFTTTPTLLQGNPSWTEEQSSGAFRELPTISKPVEQWSGFFEPPLLFDDMESEKGLRLTKAESGLFQKISDLNHTEIAEFLTQKAHFLTIGNKLAYYCSPCWQLLSPESARDTVYKLAREKCGEAARYLNSRALDEIVERIRCSPHVPELDQLPLPDHHLLCCQDQMYLWPDDRTVRHSNRYLRFAHLEVNVGGAIWYAQQQILVTLHNSFYLLRIAYTLKYFSMETLVPNSSTTKMKEFHNNLHAEIDRLAKELPELPLLSVDPAKRCDIKSFCEIYAQVVPPILKCKPYLEEDIAKNILITQLDSVDWISASRLLTMQCELVACQKAKEAASEVVSRQRKLIEQLKNVD